MLRQIYSKDTERSTGVYLSGGTQFNTGTVISARKLKLATKFKMLERQISHLVHQLLVSLLFLKEQQTICLSRKTKKPQKQGLAQKAALSLTQNLTIATHQ